MTFGSADEMISRVNAQVAEAHERARAAKELRIQIDQIRGLAKSPRGEVEVEVDSAGGLTQVKFSGAIGQLSPEALAEMVVKTSLDARRRVNARMLELTGDAFGEDSAVFSRLKEETESRFTSAAVSTERTSTIRYN